MKNLLKVIFATLLLVVIVLPVFLLAATQTVDPTTEQTVDPTTAGSVNYTITIPSFLNSNVKDVPSLVDVIINDIVIPIGSVVAVLMIMYAGFLYVTAQGASAKIAEAKNALLSAAIGAAILLGAKIIAEVVQTTVKQL